MLRNAISVSIACVSFYSLRCCLFSFLTFCIFLFGVLFLTRSKATTKTISMLAYCVIFGPYTIWASSYKFRIENVYFWGRFSVVLNWQQPQVCDTRHDTSSGATFVVCGPREIKERAVNEPSKPKTFSFPLSFSVALTH